MRLQEPRTTSPYAAPESSSEPSPIQNPGSGPFTTSSPPFQAFSTSAPVSSSGSDWNLAAADEGVPSGFQEDHIRAILRTMSLGHLILGAVLALGGICIELILRQSSFYGLAASGGMLAICGLITLLAAQRQQNTHSPLAFYLLPYADFAIVGLWLLLFSATGPVVLFYAYVVVSAALLLGSRHAIALACIAGATILAISLGQFQDQVMPAIPLTPEGQVVFTVVSSTLALGLIAYIARVFSLNLDRFIALTNRQRDQVLRARRLTAEQQEQTRSAMEHLSQTYVRFISGETGARAQVPTPNSPLAFATHLLNTLLEQSERQTRAMATHTNLEERIQELSQALDRLGNGDLTALHIVSNPTRTVLDPLTLALGRVGRQLITTQQAFKQAIGGYTAVLGIAGDLSLLHQTLTGADTALRDLQIRAVQSADHVRTLLLNEGDHLATPTTERPALHEMEVRAQQQHTALDLLHARMGHIGAQMQDIETELRRIAESMEHLTRASRPLRAEQPGARSEDKAPSAQFRLAGGLPQAPDSSPPGVPAPANLPSGTWRASDLLPRRFNGPVIPPGRPPAEPPKPWQALSGPEDPSVNNAE